MCTINDSEVLSLQDKRQWHTIHGGKAEATAVSCELYSRELQFAWPAGWTVQHWEVLATDQVQTTCRIAVGFRYVTPSFMVQPLFFFGGVATTSSGVGRYFAGFRTARLILITAVSYHPHLMANV